MATEPSISPFTSLTVYWFGFVAGLQVGFLRRPELVTAMLQHVTDSLRGVNAYAIKDVKDKQVHFLDQIQCVVSPRTNRRVRGASHMFELAASCVWCVPVRWSD